MPGPTSNVGRQVRRQRLRANGVRCVQPEGDRRDSPCARRARPWLPAHSAPLAVRPRRRA